MLRKKFSTPYLSATNFFIVSALCVLVFPLWAHEKYIGSDTGFLSDPFYLLFFLIGISLLPFIAIMVTSFAKIIVVLSITRQALGTAQAPPNIVIVSLSMILTIFSMYPVLSSIYQELEAKNFFQKPQKESLELLIETAKEPFRAFMNERTKDKDKELFLSILKKNDVHSEVNESDFIILAPAYLISELSHAFQIGFLVYLPFLVVDMTIANLLMALGMQMLSPTTISLPFKILLFVLVDGWHLLAQGLLKV
ncbi:MAG: type III secretion system export apparatus subunit SctR [Myxococcales bacterium]|nr:type III secretion system export apparatus subunit SctR [Myxococcales bacterium]USN49871.1 MAG: type III secretion system export apparatus subunit SctR [Myxococcales bacterium]